MTLDRRVRPARVDDVEAMVRLQIATWRNDYQAWLGTEFCDSSFENHVRARLRGFIEAETPFRRTLVLECGGEQAGFVAYGAADRHPGEVFSMYVEPAWRRSGAGAYLFWQAWADLCARGLTPVQIAVLERNVDAQRFYLRIGASEFKREEFDLNGRTLREVVFVLSSAALDTQR